MVRVTPACACRAGRLPWQPRRSKVADGQGGGDQRRCSTAAALAGRGVGLGRRRVSSRESHGYPWPVGASRFGRSGMLSRGIQSLRGTLRCPGGETCSRCRGLAAAGTIPRPAVVISGYRIGHSARKYPPRGGKSAFYRRLCVTPPRWTVMGDKSLHRAGQCAGSPSPTTTFSLN